MLCAMQGVFWLGRPWLFRPVLKFLVFFVSFVLTNTIYFAVIFGPKSCFFSRTGFQGLQILPWWVSSPATLLPCLKINSATLLPFFGILSAACKREQVRFVLTHKEPFSAC